MKMMGSGAWPLASSCCRSRPLQPGSWTSSTRQLGASGRWLVKNSCAEANVWTFSPVEQSRSLRLSRVDWSSSTTKTHGLSSGMAAPPGGVGPPSQYQRITRLVSRRFERHLYGMEEILFAAGFIQKGHRTGGKGARTHVVIGIRRDEDNRHAPVRRHQLTLELKSVHARQAHIENQARRLGRVIRLQERFRRRKALHTKSHGLEQIVERMPQRVVIVDNRNQRYAGHALSPLYVALPGHRLVLRHALRRLLCSYACTLAQALDSTLPSAGEHVYHPLGKVATTLGGGGRADQLF